jgi:hypothetical protein
MFGMNKKTRSTVKFTGICFGLADIYFSQIDFGLDICF